MAGSKARTVGLRALALALGLLLATGIAEGITRWAWHAGWVGGSGGPDQQLGQGRPWNVPWIRRDASIGWVPVPGFSGTVSEPESRAQLRVNSLGLRSPEPGPVAADVGRTLVVGDSFVLALQVEEHQAFPALLDQALPERVFNGGVDDYSTWQATRWYQRLDPSLEVDTVVLLFFMGNDPLDNSKGLSFDRSVLPAPIANLTRRELLYRRVAGLPPPLSRSQLMGRLSLWRSTWGAPRDDSWLMDEIVVEMMRNWLLEPRDLASFLQPTHQALQELRDATRARGDRLLVALAPPLFYASPTDRDRWLGELALRGLAPTDPDFEAMPTALAGILDGLGVPGCALAPALVEAQARGQQPYLQWNRHWTTQGHVAAAQAIQGCLAQLPASPARADQP